MQVGSPLFCFPRVGCTRGLASSASHSSHFSAFVHLPHPVSRPQWDKVQAYIATTLREGGELLCGGGRPEGERFAQGCWTAPTIFGGITPRHTIFNEEIFGPVMSITTFKVRRECSGPVMSITTFKVRRECSGPVMSITTFKARRECSGPLHSYRHRFASPRPTLDAR
jgi:hypothetical protein